MKEMELREHATCDLCNKKIGEAQFPMFAVMQIKQYVLDGQALQRQSGLEMMLGNCASLAQVMGPNEDLAKKTTDVELTVCFDCAAQKDKCVAEFMQIGVDKDEKYSEDK